MRISEQLPARQTHHIQATKHKSNKNLFPIMEFIEFLKENAEYFERRASGFLLFWLLDLFFSAGIPESRMKIVENCHDLLF